MRVMGEPEEKHVYLLSARFVLDQGIYRTFAAILEKEIDLLYVVLLQYLSLLRISIVICQMQCFLSKGHWRSADINAVLAEESAAMC